MTHAHEDVSQAKSPLSDCTVLITRPRSEARPLAERVRALGGRPLVAPLIEIAFPDAPLAFSPPIESLTERFDAVAVTSANAVRGWFRGDGSDPRHQVVSGAQWFVVGERSRSALSAVGIDAFVPAGCRTGHDLAVYLAKLRGNQGFRGNRLLYLRGSLAGPDFPRILGEAGWQLTECICYDVRSAPWPEDAWQAFLDAPSPRALLLFSPSAVRTLAHHVAHMGGPSEWLQATVIACVGVTTAKACAAAGVPVHAVANRPDRDALIDATVAALSLMGNNQDAGPEDHKGEMNHD